MKSLGGEEMFGLDYIDAAIFAALGATGCFLLSLLFNKRRPSFFRLGTAKTLNALVGLCIAMTPGKITIVDSASATARRKSASPLFCSSSTSAILSSVIGSSVLLVGFAIPP